MDVKLATLIKSLNIMDIIFSGFTVMPLTVTHFMHYHNWLGFGCFGLERKLALPLAECLELIIMSLTSEASLPAMQLAAVPYPNLGRVK